LIWFLQTSFQALSCCLPWIDGPSTGYWVHWLRDTFQWQIRRFRNLCVFLEGLCSIISREVDILVVFELVWLYKIHNLA
jgi:hypothetical protein